MKNVPIFYEIWRNINGFPPEYYIQENTKSSKARRITSKEIIAFLEEQKVEFGDLLSSCVLTSDDEQNLCGTWIFSKKSSASKTSSYEDTFQPSSPEPSQVHLPTEEFKSKQNEVKKQYKKRKQPAVLIPTEE
jgi:hypothetical protein